MDRGIEKMLVENIERCQRILPLCKVLNRPDLAAKCEATLARFESTLAEVRERRAVREKSQAKPR